MHFKVFYLHYKYLLSVYLPSRVGLTCRPYILPPTRKRRCKRGFNAPSKQCLFQHMLTPELSVFTSHTQILIYRKAQQQESLQLLCYCASYLNEYSRWGLTWLTISSEIWRSESCVVFIVYFMPTMIVATAWGAFGSPRCQGHQPGGTRTLGSSSLPRGAYVVAEGISLMSRPTAGWVNSPTVWTWIRNYQDTVWQAELRREPY